MARTRLQKTVQRVTVTVTVTVKEYIVEDRISLVLVNSVTC